MWPCRVFITYLKSPKLYGKDRLPNGYHLINPLSDKIHKDEVVIALYGFPEGSDFEWWKLTKLGRKPYKTFKGIKAALERHGAKEIPIVRADVVEENIAPLFHK